MFFGEVWHPGGLQLTEKLSRHLLVSSKDAVLDLACGIGSSTLFLADNLGCRVLGVDMNPANVREALQHSDSGNGGLLDFVVGDTHHLPFANGSFDVAILECVLSTFRDKARALRELARVLKPGGRVGITDVSVDGELPPELKSPWLQAFCIGGALSTEQYANLLHSFGFNVTHWEDERASALELIEKVRKKVFLVELLSGLGKLMVGRDDIEYAKRLLSAARKSVEGRSLSYILLTAESRSNPAL